MPIQEFDPVALAAQDPEGRLYNKDLKPAEPHERRWSTYSLFSLWMNDAHNAGNYTFAAGLFLMGLSPIQVTLGILGGALIIFAGCCMSGFMGHDTGAPYPVVSRMSWGIWGANIPALVRGAVAIAWYGIQTFLASIALKVLLLHFFPGLQGLAETRLFGLDLLGWIAFLILWGIQMVIVAKGMEAVRHFQGWAGPAIWVVMIALAIWMLSQANWNISWTQGGGDANLSTGEQIYHTIAAVGLTVGVLATAELLEKVDNDIIMLLGSGVFVLATIGVNIVANFVSAAYDISNVNPKRISFRKGGIITSILALVSMPWNLYNSPEVIAYFLGGLGALLGPFFGILALDYFWYRKGRFSIPDLYLPTPESKYYYRNGVNPQAVIAFVPSAVIALVLALVPVFGKVAPFGWFIGAALGATAYFIV